jgi:aphidicolan-16beta-ol synthase/syn-copalyl-diphosphate synthase
MPKQRLSQLLEELLADLGEKELGQIQALLEKILVEQKGLVGFSMSRWDSFLQACTDCSHLAPGCLPDADDTARGLLSIAGLETSVTATPMVAEFQHGHHFLTYQRERNPSFSTNCNVAAALLAQGNPNIYVDGIRDAILFLCTHAFETGVKDKWVRALIILHYFECDI